MTSDIVSLIANIALTLSFVVALVFGIAQVRAAARDRRERLTLETLGNFQSREFAEHISYLTFRDQPATGEELRALPTSDQILFIQFSQQMESLGMLVAEHVIDIDLVDKTLGSFVTTSWEKYKKLFMELRQKTPDPFLAEYFQWLAELIARRMAENPRTPFYEMYPSGGNTVDRRHWTRLLRAPPGAR
jgi:hypothetical protein